MTEGPPLSNSETTISKLFDTSCQEESVCLQHRSLRLSDPYAWLRSRVWNEALRDPDCLEPEIMRCLLAENDVAQRHLEPLRQLSEKLAGEVRLSRRDGWRSNLRKSGDWLYGLVRLDDQRKPVFLRTHIVTGEYDIIADLARTPKELTEDRVIAAYPSFDFGHVAFAVRREGLGSHQVCFMERVSGRLLEERLDRASFNGVFDPNGKRFFYTCVDQLGRRNAVKCHVIGTQQDSDHLIWAEEDPRFSVTVRLGQSREWLLVICQSSESTETLVVPIADLSAEPTSLLERRSGQHVIGDSGAHDFFALVSRASGHPDELLVSAVGNTKIVPDVCPTAWRVMASAEQGCGISGLLVQRNYVAWELRRGGSTTVRTLDFATGLVRDFGPQSEGGMLSLAGNDDFDSPWLPLRRISPSTPSDLILFEIASGRPLKMGNNPSHRISAAPSLRFRDRQILVGDDDVPVTLIGTEEAVNQGGRACLLTAYGAYGLSHSTAFQPAFVPLINRGFVVGIAHIRGGGERGRLWHEPVLHGRREVAIGDFLSVAEALIERGIVPSGRIVALGISAGGVASFAAVEQRPEMFCGLIGVSPFLDVLSTMLDRNLPLTTEELAEWGDPCESPTMFDRIASWCPYTSMRPAYMPPTLVLNAFRDEKVPYWGAVKWTLRCRDFELGSSPHLVLTRFDADHAGCFSPDKRDLDYGLVAAFANACARR